MKKILPLFLLIASVFTARATLLEYNLSVSASAIGGGNQGSATVPGLLIYDTEAGSITIIGWARKQYEVGTDTNYTIATVTGAKGVTYTVIASVTTSATNGHPKLGSTLVKGVNRTLKVATGQTMIFPAAMSGNADWDLFVDKHGAQWVVSGSDALTFNQARTVADNDNHLTAAQATANMVNYLQAHGYQLAVDP